MALTSEDLLRIVAQKLEQSDNSDTNQNGDLEESLDLYLGNPYGNEVEGRSSVVSTDVADSIEWIMPQIMKSFTQNNEVVVFDPVHEGDEYQAELESEYVYEVLMKQNDGFIILHQFVKDALMQRNGILKVYYAKRSVRKISSYTGISTEQFQVLMSTQGVEILEHSEVVDEQQTAMKQQQLMQQIQMLQQQAMQLQDPAQIQHAGVMLQKLEQDYQTPVTTHDVKIVVERLKGQIYVDPIPPEEFRLEPQHNSINLDTARFSAHVTSKTVSDVIEEYGLTFDETTGLPTDSSFDRTEYRFIAQEGSFFSDDDDSPDKSQRRITIAECYIEVDVDQVGIAKLMKVTVAGSDDSPTDLISAEELDCLPWVSTTAILMSHKFEGLSITDRLKQIQAQKTALWRNLFDNIYLQNNQRTVVVENQVNMDDLLVSRPGGIIRAKRLDAVMPFPTPQVSGDAFKMMQYLDQVRAGRTGVDADGVATPTAIGDRVGSQGVDRLMNAKEELVGLIIRVIAETGVKPLCVKIRDLSIKHVDAVIDFRFRGQWQKIQPSAWRDRTSCTVRVGTGSGNNAARIATLREILMLQKEMVADPSGKSSVLINHEKVYAAIDDFCKFNGLNGAVKYFLDPTSDAGKQSIKQYQDSQAQNSKQQADMQMAMIQAQQKLADAEQIKAKAQIESAQIKAQNEFMKNQLISMKQNYEAEFAALKQQLDEAKAMADARSKDAQLKLDYYKTDQNTALKLTELEVNSNLELNKQMSDNEGGISES